MTSHLFRLLVVIPESRAATLGAWWQLNVDPADNGSQWPRLSATGANPATHRWCSTALTVAQIKAIAARLLLLMSASLPVDWDTRTRAEKIAWLIAARDALRSATGIWIVPMLNDVDWESPDQSLAALGLQRIEGGA